MKKLKLNPEAFADELLSQIKPGQLNWSADEHIKFVESMVKNLQGEDGMPLNLMGTRIDQTMRLIFRPTEELERTVWKQAFTDAGYELDPEAERIFLLLFNVAQFATFLSNTENSSTGKPYIVKEKKKGAKKDTFASLIKVAHPKTATSPAPALTPATEVEENATV